MNVIERAGAHFKSLATRTIEVPEWGEGPEKPLLIYGKPMSVMAADKIFAAGKTNSFGMFVEAMIQLAQNEQGEAMFTIGDRQSLLRSAAKEVVERIGLELMRPRDGDDVAPTHEARIKN